MNRDDQTREDDAMQHVINDTVDTVDRFLVVVVQTTLECSFIIEIFTINLRIEMINCFFFC